MIRLTQTRAPSSICMRDAYCRAVMELARKNPAIVSVEADVCSSMGMEPFRQEFPERSINCGIQEANAVTMASGMSLMGMIPTFNAFATFASRRVYDQVVISCENARRMRKGPTGWSFGCKNLQDAEKWPYKAVFW